MVTKIDASMFDAQGKEIILDADADTSITADTDDQIDIKIAGADDFQFTANTFTVLSGSTLAIASGATIANSGTATGFSSADPSSADGDTLGTVSAEWSDLYLADGGVIYFGNDQDVTLTHSADSGLLLKHTATGNATPINLVLQTGELGVGSGEVIGKISFQAPDEGSGTDAILVAAAIAAIAEDDFTSSANETKLSFMTGQSEAASEKMALSSAGHLTLTGDVANANAGPVLNLYRNSATPADSDLLGELQFTGENDAGQVVEYATIAGGIADMTDGTEDGSIRIGTMKAGTFTNHVNLDEEGVFSVAGKGIFSPATFDDAPLATLHVKTSNVAGSNAGATGGGVNLDDFAIENAGHVGMIMIGNDNDVAQIAFTDNSGHAGGAGIIYFSNNTNFMAFYTDDANDGATKHFNIANDGTLTATDTSIGSISDQRLKENINDYTYDLATFKKFKPKTFDWKNPGQHGNKSGVRGFVAQDLLLVDPYWCGTDEVDEEINKPESVNPDIALVDEALEVGGMAVAAGSQYTSHLGKKDSMYISVINQLIEKVESLETKVAALEGL